MQHNRVKPMVEGGILSAVAVLFALISAYFPVFGVLANLIWPVPIILLGVRHGYKWSILATVASGIIIAAMLSPLTAVGIVVGMGLIGIVLGHGIHKGYSPFKIIGLGSAASLFSKLLVLAISIMVLGIDPFSTMPDDMAKALGLWLDFLRFLGMSEETLAPLAEQMHVMLDQMLAQMKIVLPAGFLMASIFDTYLNFTAARLVLRKLGQPIPQFPPLKYWNLPRYVSYIFIISIVMVILGREPEYQMVGNIGANLQMFTVYALLIQALALFSFFADKYSLSRKLRWLILFLIFTNPFITQIAAFIGAYDLIFDYRKLKIKPNGK
ncbi:MAG: YybS family protein [Pelosinus sp.]|nr:YybS family protein [Pelosinus sp.]